MQFKSSRPPRYDVECVWYDADGCSTNAVLMQFLLEGRSAENVHSADSKGMI